MFLTNRGIKEGKLFSGIIALESATFIHGLSNYAPNPLIMFSNGREKLNAGIIVLTPSPSTIPTSEDLVRLSKNLFVTSKERTICEIILNESSEEFIYDSIEAYIAEQSKDTAIETLRAYANKYGCIEKMEYYINTLNDYLLDNL